MAATWDHRFVGVAGTWAHGDAAPGAARALAGPRDCECAYRKACTVLVNPTTSKAATLTHERKGCVAAYPANGSRQLVDKAFTCESGGYRAGNEKGMIKECGLAPVQRWTGGHEGPEPAVT